ncbi:MAG: zeta toxin family protein [Helicobacter sp.]|nr:zeta toxin family protein [Helicobacter sp.]
MKNPVATFFSGVNGCGKTTMYYNELEKGNTFGYRINIDEIVSSFGDWRNREDQVRASKIAIKMRNKMIEERQDFNQETTLCGKSIVRLFEKIKHDGYAISLYYISVDSPQIAKERVRMRVQKGGHSIDPRIIEKRFFTSLCNLREIYIDCDDVFLFDNTQGFEMILNKRESKNFSLSMQNFISEKLRLQKESQCTSQS